ncbi:MAG: hypothetical protein IJ906_00370 [Oscillospiraceae bacterium]|nr:hypothetical protein [Oscillospiraceae bacterium]
MAIKRSITIDGMEVPFKASASLPRLYRAKFRKDIFKDFSALKDSVDESDEKNSGLGIESLEVFENLSWAMAKHADPEGVPDSPDDWLEKFNCFSIYEVLPQLFELWGMNLETQAESKKALARLTAK